MQKREALKDINGRSSRRGHVVIYLRGDKKKKKYIESLLELKEIMHVTTNNGRFKIWL